MSTALKIRLPLLLMLILSLSGCFGIKTIHNSEDKTCDLISRQLKVVRDKQASIGYTITDQSFHSPGEAAAALLVVPVASLLVSGSIAVAGNMIYWVEKQGKCEDSAVRTFTSNINTSISELGGTVLKTSEEFFEWLTNLPIESEAAPLEQASTQTQ